MPPTPASVAVSRRDIAQRGLDLVPVVADVALEHVRLNFVSWTWTRSVGPGDARSRRRSGGIFGIRPLLASFQGYIVA